MARQPPFETAPSRHRALCIALFFLSAISLSRVGTFSEIWSFEREEVGEEESPIHHQPAAPPTDLRWDYLLLVIRWPPTVCVLSGCYGKPTDFTLHGMWPNRNGSTDGPNFCSRAPFDRKTTDKLLPLLKKYWTDLEDPTQQSHMFWRHEWAKHGTCAVTDSDIRTQRQYFEAALQFRARLNLINWLRDGAIIPSRSIKYPLQQIVSTIKNATGTEPVISCRKNEYLEGLFFCLSKSLQLFECSHSQTIHITKVYPCEDNVYLLPPPPESQTIT